MTRSIFDTFNISKSIFGTANNMPANFKAKRTLVNTDTYNATGYEGIIAVDNDNPTTIQLPSASIGLYTLYIKDEGGYAGSNKINIKPFETENIDGYDLINISDVYNSYTLYSDGKQSWHIL